MLAVSEALPENGAASPNQDPAADGGARTGWLLKASPEAKLRYSTNPALQHDGETLCDIRATLDSVLPIAATGSCTKSYPGQLL